MIEIILYIVGFLVGIFVAGFTLGFWARIVTKAYLDAKKEWCEDNECN